MCVDVVVRKNTYYDSVTLMLITKEVKKIDGVLEVLVGMGTELNKELADNLKLTTKEIRYLTANDFFISVLAEKDSVIDEVVKKVDMLLDSKKSESSSEYKPATIESALKYVPDLNMALISVPGKYAEDEAKKALMNDLHVMLFSDNVSIEKERSLKELAREKGLLMMGPDCGTAIINNVPLAFANVINKGNIGIVGASGTGTQEVSVLIDKLGMGVSQVIGTGGRDLKSEVGGIMMIQGIKALIEDPETKVITLISKPPDPEVAEKVLKLVTTSNKPIVVNFIGENQEVIRKSGAYPCITLEDTAYKAVALAKGEKVKDFEDFSIPRDINRIVEEEVSKFATGQKYLRGLYTGGTLADEAMKMLSKQIGRIYSNIPLEPQYRLEDTCKSIEHTCLDLGDDEFTVGRPHPMIDPSTRVDRIAKEVEDDVAVILMDFVLGYGAHEDPVGEMLDSIKEAKEKMANKGRYLSVIASICGTDKDPQELENSKKRLEELGVIVMPSNAQAVRLTSKILQRLNI